MLVPSPRGSLLVAVDSLGRLLVVEGALMAVVRMWKVSEDNLTHAFLSPSLSLSLSPSLLALSFAVIVERAAPCSLFLTTIHRTPFPPPCPCHCCCRTQGYRDAQCGWMEVPSSLVAARLQLLQRRKASPAAATQHQHQHQHPEQQQQQPAEKSGPTQRSLLLAVYSPRRQVVELWQARQGVRLLALARVGAHCRLVQAAGPQERRRVGKEAGGSCLGRYPAECYLLDDSRGTLTPLEACLRRATFS